MNALKSLVLLCSLTSLVGSAPILDKSADPEFKGRIERARSLVDKILGHIPVVHRSWVSTEVRTTSPLQYQSLGLVRDIPNAPELGSVCKPIDQDNHSLLGVCLGRMTAGLQLYHGVLGVLAPKVTFADKATELQADLRDLLAQVNKMKQPVGQSASVAPYEGSALATGLQGAFEVEVASHLILLQIRDFTQDLKRSLRHIADLPSTLTSRA
ncbi:hypothetical protein DPEC_G00275450 [Dallia pectoralis]|uniref:Uncharacterized protein n=1 Tax=Dallia pectoralis TaxID=75939 RepID=A0ACC2FL92_DALPE|nr:hypothetical protein DPEC_G00275450 [Dallia pectoralis]